MHWLHLSVKIYFQCIEFFRLYSNPAESGEGVRCSTLSRLSQHSNTRKSLMNSSGAFLHSPSDIEDQSRTEGRDPAGASEPMSVFNPYYDKNCQDNNDQDSHPPPPLSNSQITSELIHQLLKLRSVAAAGSGIPTEPSGSDECSGGVGSHINSCLDDSDYRSHNNEESRGPFTSSPHCVQDQCDEDDKLFIL